MGGFWAGSIPPWAYAAFACACLLFLCVGELDGIRRGCREAREDAEWERLQAKTRRTHYRERPPELVPLKGLEPLEVAHEAWLAHEEQALAIANGTPGGPLFERAAADLDAATRVPADLRPDLTDSQWMAYKLADLDQYMAGLLGTHPATEEL